MKTVTIGTVDLSSGTPKVGVVIAAADRQTLMGQAGQVLTSAAEIVIWQLGAYQELDNRAELINTASQLRQVLGTIPVVAAFKHPATTMSAEKYYQTCLTLINNRAVVALDVDFEMISQLDYGTLTHQMRANDVKLCISQTLPDSATAPEMVTAYRQMAAAGADVARVTIAGQSTAAILALMTATATARDQLALPVVASASGALGRFNAVCGQLTGSAIAIGRVGHAGPGNQLPVSKLKQAIQTLATTEGV
ncbi:type I 3-dehydroquinate dehydratase [Lactiplantibacillus plajomi]|uniref:Type I 3-dehydroquinate dehydratase n=1 Tax=Lactiplantibacillus plajomi TaxID=1457217 RepID=A0ABV6K6D0_9LACO|nr:type I 3-dehydroquinate dehydratase [Lactiplantibacillus plajomi]